MTVSCCRFHVTGRVQGVFFRASTARVAQRLTLTGYARNCADGSVEVLACGQPDAVAQLGDWLWRGSPASSVSDVTRVEAEPGPIPTSFSTV